MSKKKKSKEEDEDWNEEESGSIADMVVFDRVLAFIDSYKPAMSEQTASRVFTNASLREFFSAWPIPRVGDPLPSYIKVLNENGFHMRVSVTGEPVIAVTEQ